jgi:hypothetical protein
MDPEEEGGVAGAGEEEDLYADTNGITPTLQ